jgi:tryptophan halogenase
MVGQGIEPLDYNPLVEVISSENTRAHLRQVKEAIAGAVQRMPTHDSFIRENRSAPVPVDARVSHASA